MKTLALASLIVTAFLASPAAAAATGAAAAQPAAVSTAPASNAGAPQEKKICKQLPSSSSRLPQRACLTAKQWKELQDNNDQ